MGISASQSICPRPVLLHVVRSIGVRFPQLASRRKVRAPNNRFDRDSGAISFGKVGVRSMIGINELRSAPRAPRRGQPER
jgi:hypothetical protein